MTDAAVPPARRVPAGRVKQRAWGSGLLLSGLAALGATDLVFPFAPPLPVLLFVGGFLLVPIGWLALVVLGGRAALAATAGVVASYFVLNAAAPTLQSASWGVLVRSNQDALNRAVGILEPVRMAGEARRIDPQCTVLPGLRPGDCAPLRAAMRDFGAYGAWKEGAVTMFETYSSFNARGGLLHCTRACKAPPPRPYPIFWRHVAGDWYRWAE